jgi:hypothetical protein
VSERRYRWLIRAYPKAYRDYRGAEMLTTLLDMAESGRGQPGPGLSAHLVFRGVLQRFRPPARRPLAWLGALLAAVALAAFAGVAGTWLGWQTAEAIPSDADLRALNAAITGMPAPAAVYPEVSAMKGPGVAVRADGASDYSPGRIRAALTADGWRITSFADHDGTLITFAETAPGTPVDLSTERRLPTEFVAYTATRGGLKLAGDGMVTAEDGSARYRTEVWPREPAVVRPLTVTGLAVGALAGWLLAAAAAWRIRGSGRPRRWLATGLSAAGFAAVAVPAYQHYRDVYQVLVYAHGSPYPYIVDGPADGRVILAGTAVGLLAMVTGLVAASREASGVASRKA